MEHLLFELSRRGCFLVHLDLELHRVLFERLFELDPLRHVGARYQDAGDFPSISRGADVHVEVNGVVLDARYFIVLDLEAAARKGLLEKRFEGDAFVCLKNVRKEVQERPSEDVLLGTAEGPRLGRVQGLDNKSPVQDHEVGLGIFYDILQVVLCELDLALQPALVSRCLAFSSASIFFLLVMIVTPEAARVVTKIEMISRE